MPTKHKIKELSINNLNTHVHGKEGSEVRVCVFMKRVFLFQKRTKMPLAAGLHPNQQGANSTPYSNQIKGREKTKWRGRSGESRSEGERGKGKGKMRCFRKVGQDLHVLSG